jgi:hypothetical protein
MNYKDHSKFGLAFWLLLLAAISVLVNLASVVQYAMLDTSPMNCCTCEGADGNP